MSNEAGRDGSAATVSCLFRGGRFGDGKRFLRNYSDGVAQEELFLPGEPEPACGISLSP